MCMREWCTHVDAHMHINCVYIRVNMLDMHVSPLRIISIATADCTQLVLRMHTGMMRL